ncbi:hypothetical protein [Chitinimonas naiadis]
MRIVKDKVDKVLARLIGGSGGVPVLAGSTQKGLSLHTKLWSAALVLVVIVSGLLFHYTERGMAVSLWLAALWGIFIGFTLILFANAKALTSLAGGITGIAITDMAGWSTVVEKLGKAIPKLALAMTASTDGAWIVPDATIWVFLGLVGLFLLVGYLPNAK